MEILHIPVCIKTDNAVPLLDQSIRVSNARNLGVIVNEIKEELNIQGEITLKYSRKIGAVPIQITIKNGKFSNILF